MTEEEKQAIQKRGANARALGFGVFDNPYLRADAMPSVTGEAAAKWNEKHDLWNFGWRMEDAMR